MCSFLSQRSLCFVAVLLLALLWSGCSAPPPSPAPLSSTYSIARDGYLHYRTPAGWFDVTADSQAHGNTVWLLRSDYAATITVNEIQVDAVAREEIIHQGMSQLARLTMFLSTKDKGALLHRAPEEFSVQGHPCCSYELELPATGDIMHVILIDAEHKVYAVAALKTGGAKDLSDVETVQRQFLEALRW